MDDAVVVGSGPNGLAAAVELARGGARVRVVEARAEIGGGTRSAALTLPGYLHDVCSGCHPTGILSPFFRDLPLEAHGLRWAARPASAAHPLDDQPAVLLRRSLDETAADLGVDAAAYRRFFAPFLRDPHALLADLLAPLRLPSHPLRLARFGVPGLLPATALRARSSAATRARALFAGCAAHAILPLERPLSAAVGMIFALTGHVADWPVAVGGSQAIAAALASYLRELGGAIDTGVRVRPWPTCRRRASCSSIPIRRSSPASADRCCRAGYVRRLGRYRYGPGVFKLDWALDGPIPWRDPRCLEAATVHVGGTLDEIAAAEAAVWRGEHPPRPFVMVVQQSQFDPSRAPAGQVIPATRTCTCPHGSSVDMTGPDRGTARTLRAGLPRRASWRAIGRRRRISSATIRTTSAAPSPAASPICSNSSRARWRGSIRTARRIRACSSARRPPRRAAASTACAATSPPAARSAGWNGCRTRCRRWRSRGS